MYIITSLPSPELIEKLETNETFFLFKILRAHILLYRSVGDLVLLVVRLMPFEKLTI